MASHIVVENLNHLYALQNHEEGELAYVKDIEKVYSWESETGWQEVEIESKGLELNLYDLNKNIISQMEPLSAGMLAEKASVITNFFAHCADDYYMLLCNEYHYYTIFTSTDWDEPSFTHVVMEIIAELGDVFSVEKTEGGIEFWIRPNDCEEAMIFMLFPYDAGVVYYTI